MGPQILRMPRKTAARVQFWYQQWATLICQEFPTRVMAGKATPKGGRGTDVVDLDKRCCEKVSEIPCASGPSESAMAMKTPSSS
jgi:hypothetical protein